MSLPLFDDFGASIDDIIDVLPPTDDCDAPLLDDSMGVTFARICYDTSVFDHLERQIMLPDDQEEDYDQEEEEECNHLWFHKMVCPPNIECHEVQSDVYTDEQFELDRLELEEYSRKNPRSDEANARYEKALEALEALSVFDVDKCNRTNKEFPVVASYKFRSCDYDNDSLEALSVFDVYKCNRTNNQFPVVASHKYRSCASTQTSAYDSENDSDYDSYDEM